MTISIAAGAPPIFLTKSRINSDCDNAGVLIASTGQSLVHRVYQMDPLAQWAGSSSDATTDTIDAPFYIGSSKVAQSIDAIFLLNHNLKNFKIEWFVGGVNQGIVSGCDYRVGTANFTGTDLVVFLGSSIAPDELLLTMYNCQGAANGTKLVGCWIAALSQLQFSSRPFSRMEPIPREQVLDCPLADGEIAYNVVNWSDASYRQFDFECEFDLVQTSDKTSFETLVANPVGPFLVYTEPGDVTESVYLCRVKPGTYRPKYVVGWKGAGYKLSMTLQQVGWA